MYEDMLSHTAVSTYEYALVGSGLKSPSSLTMLPTDIVIATRNIAREDRRVR